MVQLALVAAGQAPQTSVALGGVLQGDPESEQGVRFSIEIGGVLVDVDLSSDFGWLQDGHGLHDKRLLDPRFLADLPGSGSIGDIFEYFVVLVQRVPYLIDCLPLGNHQLAILEGLGLEEEADFIGGLDEVLAESVFRVATFGIEDGEIVSVGLEVVDETIDFLDGCFTGLGGDEIFDDGVAVLMEVLGGLLDLVEESSLHVLCGYEGYYK